MGDEGIRMGVHLFGIRDSRTGNFFMVFKNNDSSYSMSGVPDTIESVAYRT